MTAQLHPIPTMLGPAYIRMARVIRKTSDRIYRVALDGQGEITARMALPGPWDLHPDDTVLVAGESPASGFIIGLISGDAPKAICTSDGAGARIKGQAGDRTISVHDADERVVFEYHPGTGKSVIHATEGDLTLDAPNGIIALRAGKGIHCTSAGEVAIKGTQGVRMTAEGAHDGPEQILDLDGDGVRLGVHRMAVTAGSGDVAVEHAVYRGRRLDSRIDSARFVYDKLETVARRMWQRSGYFFKQVQHLCQVQTGRMRTLVHGAHHTQSRRTTLIAQEDVRIDGKKINLG